MATREFGSGGGIRTPDTRIMIPNKLSFGGPNRIPEPIHFIDRAAASTRLDLIRVLCGGVNRKILESYRTSNKLSRSNVESHSHFWPGCEMKAAAAFTYTPIPIRRDRRRTGPVEDAFQTSTFGRIIFVNSFVQGCNASSDSGAIIIAPLIRRLDTDMRLVATFDLRSLTMNSGTDEVTKLCGQSPAKRYLHIR